jgi:hypothetical protein
VGITERFNDEDIEALGGEDKFWNCGQKLVTIFSLKSLLNILGCNQIGGKLFSSQKFYPSYILSFALGAANNYELPIIRRRAFQS